MSIEQANYEAKQARNNETAEQLLGLYFPVLDHGFVSLVDFMGSDAAIAQAARCSYGAGTRAVNDDRALIRYLVRHKHTSPLEQCELKFHVKMPIFVARQWIRHRTANLNEMSGRYSVMPLQLYTPEIENFSYQSKDNKQGRSTQTEANFYNSAVTRLNNTREQIKDNYKWLLQEDVARELARIDLPLSTYTEMYWKIDLHNLMHFLRLRCDSHAQYEIRVFADIMAGMAKMVVPAAYEAWLDYSLGSENFSFQEMQALFNLMSEIAGDGRDSCIEEYLMFPSDEKRKEWGQKFGLTLRETNEFIGKVQQKKVLPDFTLDLSKAKTPEHFRNEAEKYVPVI